MYSILSQMARNRANGRGARPPVPPTRGCGRGRCAGRGGPAGAAPADPPGAQVQDQPPVDAPDTSIQAPVVPIVIPGLQEALAQILFV